MLDNLFFSLNAVSPIFIMVLIGYGIKCRGYLDEHTSKRMNTIIFKFAMPVMLFKDVVNSNLAEAMDPQLIAFSLITTTCSFMISWLAAVLFIKERKKVGAFVQGCFRGNFLFIGIPLIANIMGGEAPARALVVTTFVVPYYNVLAVIILTIYSGEKRSLKETALTTIKNIAANPIIWGILIGVAGNLAGFKLRGAFAQTCTYLSNIATPTMLLCIGSTLDFTKLKKNLIPALGVSFLKLVAIPLVFMSIAVTMGLPNDSLVVLYVMYAVPTAIASYTMAMMMGSDEELASNIVVLTSLLSVFTFTAGVYLLKTMGIV